MELDTSWLLHIIRNRVALQKRAVKIVKDWLKKMSEGTVEGRIAQFLLVYQITAQNWI